MPLRYKVNILEKLKEAGYTTYRLRRERILGEAIIQALRDEKPIAWATIETICDLLKCQPGDLIERTEENP